MTTCYFIREMHKKLNVDTIQHLSSSNEPKNNKKKMFHGSDHYNYKSLPLQRL